MTKLRLVHQRTVSGDILVSDIDQGLPVEHLDEERKQDVYVTYNLKTLQAAAGGGLEVVEDSATPGYVDLVLSDKVQLSRQDGVIKGLEDAGLISVIEMATGALAAPVIAAATHDTDTSATSATNDGLVAITGTGFLSTAPAITSVSLTDGVTTVTVSDGDAGVTVADTTIDITAAAHGFATDGSEDVTSVTVTADGQSDTAAPTIV